MDGNVETLTARDGPETLLSSCVPDLQLDPLAINLYLFYFKVNPAGRYKGIC